MHTFGTSDLLSYMQQFAELGYECYTLDELVPFLSYPGICIPAHLLGQMVSALADKGYVQFTQRGMIQLTE